MSVGIPVDYDGLAFNSGVPDGNGTQWYVNQLDGWDSPDPRTVTADPTTRHGTVLPRVLLNARAVVLGGIVKSPDLTSHWTAWYGIDVVFGNLTVPKMLTVTEDIDRQVGACRAGTVRKTLLGNCAFSFQINLVCPDPLKYATSATTVTIAASASATINNPGSFPTEAIVMTTNADGGVAVVNETVGGRGIVTDVDPASGTVFDFLSRSIVDVNDNDAYSVLAPYASWFTIQPGSNTVTNNGAVSVDFTYTPAWL